LLFSGALGSSSVMKSARISGSTWKKERTLLLRMGLLGYRDTMEMREGGIRRTKYYFLTEKGKEVAGHIQSVSHLLHKDDERYEASYTQIAA
jgi:hypothetical protein